jgi:tetratricopeptide (TPR) repeat protein
MRSIILSLLLLRAANANPDGGSDAIGAGLAAFEALDYERAIELLQQAFTEALSREDKRTVLRTLAFAHVARGEAEQARAEFVLLLRLDPAMELDRTISPRTRLIFEEARAGLGAQPLASAPAPSPLPALVVAPPPAKVPLYRRASLWGALAGTSVAAIVIGAVAGALAPPQAHIIIAHP